MSFAVVDASVLVAFYVADEPRRAAVVTRLGAGDELVAPAHLDVEVVSALRGLAMKFPAVASAAPAALAHLAAFPIRRARLGPMTERMWQLRNNMTPYDAAYVALAEELRCAVVTCDAKLAASSGAHCSFELLS
jgi:predicted nucleic acid-binding protein